MDNEKTLWREIFTSTLIIRALFQCPTRVKKGAHHRDKKSFDSLLHFHYFKLTLFILFICLRCWITYLRKLKTRNGQSAGRSQFADMVRK